MSNPSSPSVDEASGRAVGPADSAAQGLVGGDDDVPNPQRQLTWSDFNALAGRIGVLEQQRGRPSAGSAGERVGLLDDEEKDAPGVEDGAASGSPPADPTADDPEEEKRQSTTSMIESEACVHPLPESTYTYLMTEDVLSIPFLTGLIAIGLCITSLIMAFRNEKDQSSPPRNQLGMPAGVGTEVRIASYLGVIFGVLLEEEIPQGLELIGKGAAQHHASDGRPRFSMMRVVIPALLRLVVGYTFLLCLFLTVVQEETVLGIFQDVLALQFVEGVDDAIFKVSQRGFFGRALKDASENVGCMVTSTASPVLQKWTTRLIRFIYTLNMCLGVGALTYYTLQQQEGEYRCKSVSIMFGDEIFEDAWVLDKGEWTKRLLIYSHFNGIYKENRTAGYHHGRPIYTEQNKEDGDRFQQTTGAEIVYCEEIESWVFRHPHIRTSDPEEGDEKNKCQWLLRSEETESYDLIQLGQQFEWHVWKGLAQTNYEISIECNECVGESSCNYNGICVDEQLRCACDEFHFGPQCQYQSPCEAIRSEKDNATVFKLLAYPKVYGRPMYVLNNLSGKPYSLMRLPENDDQQYELEYPNDTVTGDLDPHKHHHQSDIEDDDLFEQNSFNPEFIELLQNYTFIVYYTGQRWYGQMIPPGLTEASFVEEEYHAFWKRSFLGLGKSNSWTVIISASSGLGSPVGVDFFEMRRRNTAFEGGVEKWNYSPFGVLIPLVEYKGSGFFHCT